MSRRIAGVLALLGIWWASAAPVWAQAEPSQSATPGEQVQLDFNDVELSVVIDTIARLTG